MSSNENKEKAEENEPEDKGSVSGEGRGEEMGKEEPDKESASSTDIKHNAQIAEEACSSASGMDKNKNDTGESSFNKLHTCETNKTQEEKSSEASIEMDDGQSAAVDDTLSQRTTRPRRRQYRLRISGTENSSEDEDNIISEDSPGGAGVNRVRSRWEAFMMSSSSSDSSQSALSIGGELRNTSRNGDENEPTPKALQKTKPIHKWSAVREIVGREVGAGSRWPAAEKFQHRYYGSLHAVQRLELMYKLDGHSGCVNSLNFNRGGDMLVSTSDDRRVVLWDWAAGKRILSYNSGHTGNVFQAKFLPLSGDLHIVTCARDGQVRLGLLSSVEGFKDTRLLAQNRRTTHKLAIHHDTPHVFLSAGEDALVLSHDVRTNKSNKLLVVKEGSSKVGLYSINSNPSFSKEFIVTGEDQYIRLYDKRKVTENTPLNKFCPKSLLKSDVFLHVTSAVFNYNGTEIIGSYNDDDIYLFDTRQPVGSDYVYKYEGHRNSITVKGVNFFGPKSEYIVSGSDCGNIFFWDKSTEAIVQWMRGDEEGVVNYLEPHPQVPIIATSGLDSDIKVWVPSCEQEPTLKGLKATVVSNQKDRMETMMRRSDPFDNQQMRWLWQQIQNFERRRDAARRSSEGQEDDAAQPSSPLRESNENNSSSSSSEEEGHSGRPQCSPS